LTFATQSVPTVLLLLASGSVDVLRRPRGAPHCLE
jgi:hypothetical protein